MRQTITTSSRIVLSPDADIREDHARIVEALSAAVTDATNLGGHAQRIASIEIDVDETFPMGGSGAIEVTGALTITTELA